jgi:hypothetical protein
MAPLSNTALRVTELDFDSIKNNLKNFLRSQSEFTDFDFEGSGMSVLLDVLAYNTHYMGFYLNMLGNESFLDTSQIRESVISHAKALNYVPNSRQGALAKLNIIVTPESNENQNTSTLTLDRYTRFIGETKDGINYTFAALNSNTAIKSGGSFSFANVIIKQGEVISTQYEMTADNSKRIFTIPSSNVDIQTLSVLIQESSTNTYSRAYTKAQDITELSANSEVYFVEEGLDNNYIIQFGDDFIGKKPKNGSIITVTYLDTVGGTSNGIFNFARVDKIGGIFSQNVVVNATAASYGGMDKETVEQVRFRAPYHYITQNRAVTAQDYETLVIKDFPSIDSVAVWGGEDNDPVVYGKVYLSLKTKQNFALTNVDKEYIKNELIRNRNVLTVTPEIVDPDYAYIRVIAKVSYNPNLTTLDAFQISEKVKAAIYDYNDLELNKFNATFRKSKLQFYIDNADPSITASDVTLFVQKRVLLDTTSSIKYDIGFNMPLRKGTFQNKIFSFPETLQFDSSGTERNVLFEEVLDAPTGINSIIITDGGNSYSQKPTVTITGDGYSANARAVIVNGRINSIEITNKGFDYTKAEVTISGGGGVGARATAQLESNFGTVRSFYYTPTGEKVVVNATIGRINYSKGTVVITPLRANGTIENDFYDTNILTFFAPINTEIIRPLRNRITLIDETDSKSVQVDMIAES